MPKTKHEKRFYALFKDNTPVECARLLVEEERDRWVNAAKWFFLNVDLEKWGAAELLHLLLEAYEKNRIPGGK